MAAIIVLAGCAPSGAESATTNPSDAADELVVPAAYTPVTATQLGSATRPFLGSDGVYHVAYDLQLTNATKVPATLDKVEVVDAADRSRVLASFAGTVLVDPECVYGNCNRLRTLPSSPAPDTAITPQESRVLLVDFSFDSMDDAPKAVLHRMYVTGAASPAAKEGTAVDYLVTPFDVSAGETRVISAPYVGDNWVAQNGCCLIGFPHVPSLLPLSGALSNSQRFAIDWMHTNDDGAFYEGDKTKNESYFGYGQEVRAVADGTISSTLDEVDANQPGILPANDPVLAKKLTVDNVDGNHIVQDIGGGAWAMYAHLIKGSLLVKPGDKVTAGQVIGKLGNTGNSNAPHLHFQLMNGPNLIGSDAVPYVLDEFLYAGYIAPEDIIGADDYVTGEFFQHHLTSTQARKSELPMAGSIINVTP